MRKNRNKNKLTSGLNKICLLKKTIYILLFIGFSSSGIAQDSLVNRNNVFIELWGGAGLYSLNYERIFSVTPSLNMTARIGGEYLYLINYNIIGCPISSSILFGKRDNRIELGIGCAYLYAGNFDVEKNLLNGLIIGYRLQPINKHVIIRITYSPILIKSLNSSERSFHQLGGFSFGYSF
jgi:hypothetical protein